MIFEWYQLFNLTEWIEEGLVARTLLLDLEDRGRTQFLLTQGNTTGITYDGEFLPVNFLGQNPYTKNGYGIYVDDSDNVWFGFQVKGEE